MISRYEGRQTLYPKCVKTLEHTYITTFLIFSKKLLFVVVKCPLVKQFFNHHLLSLPWMLTMKLIANFVVQGNRWRIISSNM